VRLVAGFPPRRPGFDPRSGHVGFVVDKAALGQVFSEYYGFPCQFSFHQLFHTHLSPGAGTLGQMAADVPSGLSLTPPQETKKKKNTPHEILQSRTLCVNFEPSVKINFTFQNPGHEDIKNILPLTFSGY
jgi:hypothetical protein